MEKVIYIAEIGYGSAQRIAVRERAGGDQIKAMIDIPREASWALLAQRFKDMAAQCERAAGQRGEVQA